METTECALRKNSVIKRTGKKTSACAGVFFLSYGKLRFHMIKGVVCDTLVTCTVYTGSTRYHAAVNNVRISL